MEPPLRWIQKELLLQKDNKFEFHLHFQDTNCSREGVIRAIDQMKSQSQSKNPRAFIGPVCPFAAQYSAIFSQGPYFPSPPKMAFFIV